MKNTRVYYIYRDGENNKLNNACVVPGRPTNEQVARISASLDDGYRFIPEKVGLPVTRFDDWNDQYDGPFCELYTELGAFVPTDEPPTVNVDWDALVSRFEQWAGKWPEDYDPNDEYPVRRASAPDNGDGQSVSLKGVLLLGPEASRFVMGRAFRDMLSCPDDMMPASILPYVPNDLAGHLAAYVLATAGIPVRRLLAFGGTIRLRGEKPLAVRDANLLYVPGDVLDGLGGFDGVLELPGAVADLDGICARTERSVLESGKGAAPHV